MIKCLAQWGIKMRNTISQNLAIAQVYASASIHLKDGVYSMKDELDRAIEEIDFEYELIDEHGKTHIFETGAIVDIYSAHAVKSGFRVTFETDNAWVVSYYSDYFNFERGLTSNLRDMLHACINAQELESVNEQRRAS